MLRRAPTRITLNEEDLLEFDAMQKEKEKRATSKHKQGEHQQQPLYRMQDSNDGRKHEPLKRESG